MNEEQRGIGAAPTGPFDHPEAGAFREHSSDDKSGYQDDDTYTTTGAAKDAGARGEALPPRAPADVPREAIVSRSRGK